jgi:hypothetical protein
MKLDMDHGHINQVVSSAVAADSDMIFMGYLHLHEGQAYRRGSACPCAECRSTRWLAPGDPGYSAPGPYAKR